MVILILSENVRTLLRLIEMQAFQFQLFQKNLGYNLKRIRGSIECWFFSGNFENNC